MSNRPKLGVEVIDSPTFGRFTDLREQLDPVHADTIHTLDLLPEYPEWEREVSDVAVILSASRSGSSLLYNAIVESGDVIAAAGEHEPWLTLTNNKWPFTDSDVLEGVNGRDNLLTLIRNDLLVRGEAVLGQEVASLLHNRTAVRQMETNPRIRKLIDYIGNLTVVNQSTHERVAEIINQESGTRNPALHIEQISDIQHFVPIENPPLIDQPLARRATLAELRTKTVLFKSPADAYRPGMYESLFPNARITYLHLTRGFAQTTNGLMDGWSKDDTGFISNAVGLGGNRLSIDGYSETVTKRVYWCFDLPANWRELTGSSLLEVCAQQWLQAHRAILENFKPQDHIQFESFYTDPEALSRSVKENLGVDLSGYNWGKEIMSTEKPKQFRWLKRAELFSNLGSHLTKQTVKDISELQRELGYSMEESTWH